MLQFPEKCFSCPLYNPKKRMGFIQDDVPSTAKVVIVHDQPDGRTAADNARDVWESRYFFQKFFRFLKLAEREVGFGHVLRCKNGRGVTGKRLADAKKHCRAYDDFGDDSIVVTTGQMGWKLFTNNKGGSRKDYRGFFIEEPYNHGDVDDIMCDDEGSCS